MFFGASFAKSFPEISFGNFCFYVYLEEWCTLKGFYYGVAAAIGQNSYEGKSVLQRCDPDGGCCLSLVGFGDRIFDPCLLALQVCGWSLVRFDKVAWCCFGSAS
jgi:hypothetical protein